MTAGPREYALLEELLSYFPFNAVRAMLGAIRRAQAEDKQVRITVRPRRNGQRATVTVGEPEPASRVFDA